MVITLFPWRCRMHRGRDWTCGAAGYSLPVIALIPRLGTSWSGDLETQRPGDPETRRPGGLVDALAAIHGDPCVHDRCWWLVGAYRPSGWALGSPVPLTVGAWANCDCYVSRETDTHPWSRPTTPGTVVNSLQNPPTRPTSSIEPTGRRLPLVSIHCEPRALSKQ